MPTWGFKLCCLQLVYHYFLSYKIFLSFVFASHGANQVNGWSCGQCGIPRCVSFWSVGRHWDLSHAPIYSQSVANICTEDASHLAFDYRFVNILCLDETVTIRVWFMILLLVVQVEARHANIDVWHIVSISIGFENEQCDQNERLVNYLAWRQISLLLRNQLSNNVSLSLDSISSRSCAQCFSLNDCLLLVSNLGW